MPIRFHFSQRVLLGVVLALWCAGLATGALALWRYSATPGSARPAPVRWPAQALVQRQPGKPTLVMLAHPHCPCTRASLTEFSQLMAAGDADGIVLFLRPEAAAPGWEKTALWEIASAIPRVRVFADADGTAAQAFGAETSGHVLFYDATGTLRFSGGITMARGHIGPSAGGAALRTALHGGTPSADHTPTFGCPLQSPESPR